VEAGIDCGERWEEALAGPNEGEYGGFPEGRTKSEFGKAHSVFMPETGLRSCCPDMRAEPAYICAWDMGALKEVWRKPSSYFTAGDESCPGVELGRTIAEGEGFQLSDSE